jgi:hypothetical protein
MLISDKRDNKAKLQETKKLLHIDKANYLAGGENNCKHIGS